MALPYPPPQGYNIAANPAHQGHQGLQYPINAPNPNPPARMNIQVPMVSNPAFFNDQSFNLSNSRDQADDEDIPSSTAISLLIRTPLFVEGNDNVLAIDASSAASRVAEAVVQGLKQICFVEEIGLPMLDEDGRPRPIKVEVQAETKVTGSKNILGEKAILQAISGDGVTRDKIFATMQQGLQKRERVESEQPDVGSKRSRHD